MIQSQLKRSSGNDSLSIVNLDNNLTSPLGRKSRPTTDSRTDDFPADCVPRTAILGSVIYC